MIARQNRIHLFIVHDIKVDVHVDHCRTVIDEGTENERRDDRKDHLENFFIALLVPCFIPLHPSSDHAAVEPVHAEHEKKTDHHARAGSQSRTCRTVDGPPGGITFHDQTDQKLRCQYTDCGIYNLF